MTSNASTADIAIALCFVLNNHHTWGLCGKLNKYIFMKKAAKILCIIAMIIGLIWAVVGFFGTWIGGAVVGAVQETVENSESANATMEKSVSIMLRLLGSFVVVIIGGVLGIVGANKKPSLNPIILGILTFMCGYLLFPLSNYLAAALYLVAGLLLFLAGVTTKQVENIDDEQLRKKKLRLTITGIAMALVIAVISHFIFKDSSELQPNTSNTVAIEKQQEQSETSENLGIWEVAYFVDDFGEPTKDGYIRTEIKGTFSNDLTQNSKLGVRFIITDAEIIDMKFYQYNGNSPTVLYVETSYRLLVKDSKEKVHTLMAYHNHDRLSLTPMESKKLYQILLQGGAIKFNIVSSNDFSNRDTEYNFTIDNADGFENAVMKLIDSNEIDTRPAI